MIIDVARLPDEGTSFEGEEAPSILDVDGGRDVRIDSPLAYSLTAQVVTGELIVSGSLRARVSLRCCRCAEFFGFTIVEPAFNAVRTVGEKLESVDLTADMREAMLLIFPTYPLCKKGCKGLCARCGGNLNKIKCSCRPPEDIRWGALGDLKIKGK